MRMTYSHGNAARINLFDVLLYIHVSLKEYSLRSSSPDRATALAGGRRRKGKKIVYFCADNYTRVRRRATLFSSRAIFGRFTRGILRTEKKNG